MNGIRTHLPVLISTFIRTGKRQTFVYFRVSILFAYIIISILFSAHLAHWIAGRKLVF